jgi:hypothetical protein
MWQCNGGASIMLTMNGKQYNSNNMGETQTPIVLTKDEIDALKTSNRLQRRRNKAL